MTSYRDSDAYRRSQKVDPYNGKPVYPLAFLDRPRVVPDRKPVVQRGVAG